MKLHHALELSVLALIGFSCGCKQKVEITGTLPISNGYSVTKEGSRILLVPEPTPEPWTENSIVFYEYNNVVVATYSFKNDTPIFTGDYEKAKKSFFHAYPEMRFYKYMQERDQK